MITKAIKTSVPVLDIIAQRYSPRSFSDQPVEAEKLLAMFEAARLSPSAHNTQPWRFVVTRKGHGDGFRRSLDCLYSGNQQWAQTAPVLVLAAVSKQRFSQRECTPVDYPHARHDLGMAVMAMILQGQSMGIWSHPIAGFHEDHAKERFLVPDGYEPFLMMAIGYLGDGSNIPTDVAARDCLPRSRRSIHELVFDNQWGEVPTAELDCEPALT